MFNRTLRVFVVAGFLLGVSACSMPRMGSGEFQYVRPGDTLYSIAFDHGLDYREVARWNGIKPPYRIYPGQRLALVPSDTQMQPLAYYSKPVENHSTGTWAQERGRASSRKGEVKTRSAESKTAPARKRTASSSRSSRVIKAPVERASFQKSSKNVNTSTKWRWPTAGEVVTRFALKRGKKGIDIQGRSGQEVLATAGGDVVYSGKGLIGYGNMVIIKHSETYLSAYGHNRRLLVKEGERVTSGQKIAEMGQRSKSRSILHFEIRKNGRPVDPIRYLPTKN